jgi:hypothetical protein
MQMKKWLEPPVLVPVLLGALALVYAYFRP